MSKLTDQQKIELVEKYKSGKYNCASLGREYNIRGDSVRDILIRRNVQLKSASESCRKYSLNENFFEKIDTEEKAYFLGLLYADGYNNEKRGEIHLTLQEGDKNILEILKNNINSTRPLMFIELSKMMKNQKDAYRFDISSQKISKKLKELGCPQAKSFILKFPTEEQVPKQLLNHFIRGYFDGDGCFVICNVKNNYRQYSVCIVSTEDFCKKLQDIVMDNIQISTYLSVRHKERNNSTRNFHISGNKQVIKFLDWIYNNSNIYLDRKYQKYINEKK